MKGLAKKEREDIFRLFLDKNKLKFTEIERALNIRSNMISYHLSKMQEEGLLEKKEGDYSLTKNAEKYIPVFSHVIGKNLSPLPVILVAVMNGNKILLIKRNKRPYKNYWSMIGGKMLLEESFEDASLRVVKEKAGIDSKYNSINAILHERVKGDNIIKHSFILFFTKVLTKEIKFKEMEAGTLKWFDVKKIPTKRIIPSDLWLLKNELNSKIDVKTAHMLEKKGNLSRFSMI